MLLHMAATVAGCYHVPLDRHCPCCNVPADTVAGCTISHHLLASGSACSGHVAQACRVHYGAECSPLLIVYPPPMGIVASSSLPSFPLSSPKRATWLCGWRFLTLCICNVTVPTSLVLASMCLCFLVRSLCEHHVLIERRDG